jgi:hypothetical protein
MPMKLAANDVGSISAVGLPKIKYVINGKYSRSYSWFAKIKCRPARLNAGSFVVNIGSKSR